MAGIDGNEIKFRFSIHRSEFKNKIASAQPKVILDLLLDARSLYMYIAGGFGHDFWHFVLKTFGNG